MIHDDGEFIRCINALSITPQIKNPLFKMHIIYPPFISSFIYSSTIITVTGATTTILTITVTRATIHILLIYV
jgi:hypothetical protein